MISKQPIRFFASGKRFFHQCLAGAIVGLVGLCAHHGSAATVYAIAGRADNSYQFGSFSLTPTSGSEGSYSYAWTSLGSASSDALLNLTADTGGNMYAMHGFGASPDWEPDYKRISTDGVLGATMFTVPSSFGMAYNAAGNLFSVSMGMTEVDWLELNSADGSTVSTSPLSPILYSQFGGNLAAGTDGLFYFADDFGGRLFSISSTGSQVDLGALSGTAYDDMKWKTLFQAGGAIYLLNENRLFTVNLSDAALTQLGTVTDLPGNFGNGFSGAVSPIPEPASTLGTAALLASSLMIRRRKRRH